MAARITTIQTRGRRVNYKQLVSVNYSIPRRKRLKPAGQLGTLYPITVKSKNSSGVLIHYVGYGSEYDEWRPLTDVVHLLPSSASSSVEKFDLNKELAVRIKSVLVSHRKSNPVIRIDVPFDSKTFNQGLKTKSYVSKHYRGKDHYKITKYSDLDDILGCGWHYRGLNSAGDFCYAILETIEFYFYRRRPLVHYTSGQHGQPAKTSTPRGFMLAFMFVRGDGTASDFCFDNQSPHCLCLAPCIVL